MKISYHILPADIRRNFRHSISRSRNKGALPLLLLSIVLLSLIIVPLWDAWLDNTLGISTFVIITAILVPPLLVMTMLSMHAFEQLYPKGASAPLSTTEISPIHLCFDKRRVIDEDELVLEPVEATWSDVSGIYWHGGDLVFLCSGRIPNNFIPKTAFASPQEAELFYKTARQHWEAVKYSAADAGRGETVWPPAPRPGNSAEPDNTREG